MWNKEEEDQQIIKVFFISQTPEDTKVELTEYYIKSMIPEFSGEVNYIEEESCKIYDGNDQVYHNGNYKVYVFTFMCDKFNALTLVMWSALI